MAEVAREHGWHPPKSLNSDENFKPEHTLFCRELRFVAIYALFGDLLAKKVPFWVKNSVSWARSALLHGTELNLQICDSAQKLCICHKNCKYALDKNFHGHFAPDETLPSSATLNQTYQTKPRSKDPKESNPLSDVLLPMLMILIINVNASYRFTQTCLCRCVLFEDIWKDLDTGRMVRRNY